MKKIIFILLLLFPLAVYSQMWETDGGKALREGFGKGGTSKLQPSPVPPEPEPPTPGVDGNVYGFRIRQMTQFSSENSVEYADDAVNMTPVASETSGGMATITLGSWENWINDHFTPVMLKSDGTVDYELSRTNQNYRSDGVTPSDIANTSYDGNAMVKVKKFYLSINIENEDGTPTNDWSQCYVHIKICDVKKDNTYTCYGFIDSEGNECDYAYYSMYEGSMIDNKIRSISGQQVYSVVNTATASAVLAARANGNGWNIDNLALYNAIRLAHVLIGRTVRTMYIYGYGNGNVKRDTGMSNDASAFVSTTPGNNIYRNYKTCWIENFFGGYSANAVNGLYIFNSTGSNGVATFSYRLQEPYDDLSLFTTTNLAYAKKISNYSFTTINIPLDNVLLPRGTSVDSYGVARETNDAYSYDQVSLGGSTASYRNNIMATLGGSLHYSNSIGCGFFAVTNTNDLADFNKVRLTYLPQPASLAQHYQTNSVNTLSTLSMPRNNLLQIQPVDVVEEPMNTISTETMEVNE